MTAAHGVAALVALGLFSSGTASAQTNEPDPPEQPVTSVPEPIFQTPKTDLAEPKALEPALRRALEIPRGFCKSADHELSRADRRMCDLAPAAKERCPAFARACAKATSKGTSANASGDGAGKGKRKRGRRGDGSRESEGESDDPSLEVSTGPIGEILGGIIKAIAWGVLILGIGAMLVAGISALLGRRRDPKDGAERALDATTAPVPRQVPSGSPEALLSLARELAMAGELKAAMAVVLRALLRHLEIRGRLDLHPSRTNGDYVRSLRQKGHDPAELRRVAAEVEAIEFGGGRASPEAFSALHSRVSKLVQVVGVCIALLSLGVLTGCSKRPPKESSVNSCGTDASGYSALCETLRARGVKVQRRFSAIQSIADGIGRVVVLEDDLEAIERKVLLHWVEGGGTLVVFEGASSYDERLVSFAPCGRDLTLEPKEWNVAAASKPRFRLPGTRTFFAEPAGSRSHVRCGDAPFALEVSRGAGSIIAVADWRFPTNASLAIEQNAVLAAALVALPGTTVELVGAWTGTGSELPAQSLLRSGLLPWFFQVLALGFALALYRGSPFGSRREPVSVTRRAFAEHALALGDAYSRARASRVALVNFGSWALERLRMRIQAAQYGRLSDLASAVASRHSVSEAEVMSLVVAVRSAEDQAHDSATEAEHLAALRRLAALVKKTGGSS